MVNCEFINSLSRLRKSSIYSIDNVFDFENFKEYMHITRSVERDLKEILKNVNRNGKKTLILLCGSAGDGKSHLLSYLHNVDYDGLLKDYVLYNDATESCSPLKTAVETLYDLLSPFNDSNLSLEGNNVILAINLGVLSNFIESDMHHEFGELKNYVERCGILTTKVIENFDFENSNFRHVSFSDYQMYSLTQNGAYSEYIERIFYKIFNEEKRNPFYSDYLKICGSCPLNKSCPVKMNYIYLTDNTRQKYITSLLIQAIIQDKMILTTREVLNFVYDILVPPSFDYVNLQKFTSNASMFLKEFFNLITPNLLFNSLDISNLLNVMKRFDPLLIRTEDTDLSAVVYYAKSGIEESIKSKFVNISYRDIFLQENMMSKINNDILLKSKMYSTFIRLQNIDNPKEFNNIYSNYIKDLYNFNAGKTKQLKDLNDKIHQGIKQWCGIYDGDNFCIDEKKGYSVYEKIELIVDLRDFPEPIYTEEIQRFIPYIRLSYRSVKAEVLVLNIDYSLYELINKLNMGYIQTSDDRNNHAGFTSFVERILAAGSFSSSITVIDKNDKIASITKDIFGDYKFKVIR